MPGKSATRLFFHFRDTRFKRSKFLAGSGQNFRLRIKFLATHQIQSREESGQQSTEVLLHILCRRCRKHFPDAQAQIIK